MFFTKMSSDGSLNVNVEIPFPSKQLAEVAYHALRVHSEPKRSGVTKEITLENTILKVTFSGQQAGQLRVALNGFFDSILLVGETIEFLGGEPISKTYSHFN